MLVSHGNLIVKIIMKCIGSCSGQNWVGCRNELFHPQVRVLFFNSFFLNLSLCFPMIDTTGLLLIHSQGHQVCISRPFSYSCIILWDRFLDFKAKAFIESLCIFIIRLHVQINLFYVGMILGHIAQDSFQ